MALDTKVEEDGFGAFTFAPLSNHIRNPIPNRGVISNPTTTMINGPNLTATSTSDDGDDDWGDFVAGSGGLHQTLSLPKISKPSDSVDSAPSQTVQLSRVDSGWAKPSGALPLSFFGELEEAEELGSGAAGSCLEDKGAGSFVSVKGGDGFVKEENNEGSVNVSDLLADLFKRREAENGSRPDFGGTDSVQVAGKQEEVKQNLKSGELGSGWDWNVPNGVKPSLKGLDLDWNQNGLDSAKEVNSIANGGDVDNEDEDEDGWEFKAAESSRDVKEDSSKMKTETGLVSNVNGLNPSWNALSLDSNGWSWNVNSSTNWSNTNAEGKGKLGNIYMNSETLTGDEDTKIKTVEVLNLNFQVSASTWDFLPVGSKTVGANSTDIVSSGKQSNSVSVNGITDSNDGWGFKDAEPELIVRDGSSVGGHTKTRSMPVLNFNGSNSSWDMLSFSGEGMNSKVNGVDSDIKQVDDSLDEANNFEDEDGWEFKAAESKSCTRDGNIESGVLADLFSTSLQDNEKTVEFAFYSNALTQNGAVDHKNELKDWQTTTANDGFDSNKDSWNAFSDIGLVDKEVENVAEATSAETSEFDIEIKGSKTELNNHKGALPLSFFGFEEEESDDPVILEDISSQMPTLNTSNGTKKPISNPSINDLISSLYSQAEPIASLNHTQISSESGIDCKDPATPELVNANDDFDDDSWEFKDASSGPRAADQPSVLFHGECHRTYSTRLELNDFVDFFSKLKLELHFVAQSHLDNLKEVRSAAINKDAEIEALEKEIQDLQNVPEQNGTISGEVQNRSPGKICLSLFLEVLQQPKFHALESEYQLSKKLSLAESDLTPTIELLKHVDSVVKILTLVSKEEQSGYVSTWSEMLSVCAQELEHGGFIWKQAFEKNVHDQILSKPQGKKQILALGEIYRIVEVLRCSARLYKPWVLASSADPMGLFTLIDKCSTLWSSCGLEGALQSISDPADESVIALLESIKHIHNLDELVLYNHVVSGGGPICRLSALAAGSLPGKDKLVNIHVAALWLRPQWTAVAVVSLDTEASAV
ncbi:hypothetical protein Tsubulata_039471 [Turnera subulata]|uniref:Synergin gamma C-terminal domain-containing protein n=1 Tax=Turnera subulata TaxID=218843 RepID=A0A9Q0J014_9ROSI|nr:hypothetical protein Tsubulata_039471 [Turnera subulata]